MCCGATRRTRAGARHDSRLLLGYEEEITELLLRVPRDSRLALQPAGASDERARALVELHTKLRNIFTKVDRSSKSQAARPSPRSRPRGAKRNRADAKRDAGAVLMPSTRVHRQRPLAAFSNRCRKTLFGSKTTPTTAASGTSARRIAVAARARRQRQHILAPFRLAAAGYFLSCCSSTTSIITPTPKSCPARCSIRSFSTAIPRALNTNSCASKRC